MQRLWLALVLGMVISPALIFITSSVNAEEPKYNLGVAYDETFPKLKQGGTDESTMYFYSAFGTVTCYVTASVDNCPSGWRVKFEPENLVVEPQPLENESFDVGENEFCLSLSYTDENGVRRQGWAKAWPMKVSITAPEDAEPDNYPVRISYVGDFRMGGMSAVQRAGSIDWTIEVEAAEHSNTPTRDILPLLAACVVAVGAMAVLFSIIRKRRFLGD